MIAEEKVISVEFSHNPHLKETDVFFNGRAPKVNSAVEKHPNEWQSDRVGESLYRLVILFLIRLIRTQHAC